MNGNQLERRTSTVADRQNVDIEGLRERIVNLHADNPMWERLSMSQKLRLLIEKGLEAEEQVRQTSQPSK
jgi:hypothetical protein